MPNAPQTLLAFGDVHIPHQNDTAVEVLCRVAEKIKPDITVCLGDILDCGQFSSHPPTYGVPETDYQDDLQAANALLDRMQASSGKMAMVEGNHEYRLDRWAGGTSEGRGAYSLLAPRIQLAKGRKGFKYVPYGSADAKYPCYRINSRVVAVHGWSYAQNATRKHLTMAQGMSVIHGHTHRAETLYDQGIWNDKRVIEVHSAGCLCRRIPFYGIGAPRGWVNAFVFGHLGKRSESLYVVPILGDRCILPDGTEITA